MGDSNESILDIYLYETNAHLEQLDIIILDAEQVFSFTENDVATMFRIMHTIKGSSAMMEFDSLTTIAHKIEDLFFIIRENTMDMVPDSLRPEIFDLLFHTIDFFRSEMEKLKNKQPLSDDIDTLLEKINTLIKKISSPEPYDHHVTSSVSSPVEKLLDETEIADVQNEAAQEAPSDPVSNTNTSMPIVYKESSKDSLLSVSLCKLDSLMAIVGEIVIAESMLTTSPDLNGLRLDNFMKSARHLRKLTDELQDISMSLRMVPVSLAFQKMNRIVRDMSKNLNKRVRLTLIGEDTEVDKTIFDAVSDPIMHIIRNSMDHGIEAHASQRIAAGKDEVGEIILSARHTGSEVIIEIKDDGQGVDLEKVLAKAISQGLASADEEYSSKKILNLLTMPGFSTNSEVTKYSGRGIGMDVVKKNLDEIGGTVVITSICGEGMTTTLKIPSKGAYG